MSVIVDSTCIRLIAMPNFTCRAPVIQYLSPPNREQITGTIFCFTFYKNSRNKTQTSCVSHVISSRVYRVVSIDCGKLRMTNTRVWQPQMALHSCNFFVKIGHPAQKLIWGYSIRTHGQHGDIIRRRKQKNKET